MENYFQFNHHIEECSCCCVSLGMSRNQTKENNKKHCEDNVFITKRKFHFIFAFNVVFARIELTRSLYT